MSESNQNDGSSGFDRDQMNALLGGGFSERLLRQSGASGAAGAGAGAGTGTGPGAYTSSSANHLDRKKEVADMTIQETAAYLRETQQQQKQHTASLSAVHQPRHRTVNTGKVRQYHQLLSEQHQQQQQQEKETAVAPLPASASASASAAAARYDSDSDSEDANDANHNHTVQEAQAFVRPTRTKAAPKVLVASAAATTATATTHGQAQRQLLPRKRQRRYNDSDDDSDNDSDNSSDNVVAAAMTRRRRRRAASSSSSSSSSSSDNETQNISRRQRLLNQRQRTNDTSGGVTVDVAQTLISKENSDEQKPPRKDVEHHTKRHDDDDDNTSESEADADAPPKKVVHVAHAPKPAVVDKVQRGEERSSGSKSGSSSSGEESSSGSSGSSSSTSDDDDDDMTPIAKPLFVPKHKRGSVQTAADSTAAQTAADKKRIQAADRRLRESRAMVQQVVTAEATKQPDYDTALEGITGARNAMPDDTDATVKGDDDDDDTAQDAWEVRELERLLADWDLEVARRDDERELARRRALTDEERLQEDMASGRYQRPGSRPDEDGNGGSGGAQRYYHKGAFYMDESEWNESDVRHKAAEYAKAATGSDKVDRRKLPAAMRVKNFGFANQSKYKGMAAEDTTDRQMNVLPLVQSKGGSKRK